MLRLVETLALKAERAKSTTVDFFPLTDCRSKKCSWCKEFSAFPKGWSRFNAIDHKPGGIAITGYICADPECRISIMAQYSISALYHRG
jgi:hypothetical protein